MRALYPELKGQGSMLDFLSHPYLDSDTFPSHHTSLCKSHHA